MRATRGIVARGRGGFERRRRGRAGGPEVVIIGAGFGGLCAAIRLLRSGYRRITILEAGEDLGGTWRDNTYPGAACDVPSHLYSFSFAPRRDWTRKFPEQAEILDYLERTATRFGVRPHLRLRTRVTSAVFDETTGRWDMETVTRGAAERGSASRGSDETGSGGAGCDVTGHQGADVLVVAVGQLNVPFVPDLPGLDGFRGEVFHSARWRHDLDLTGQRVGVVGNGASAVQFLPPVADEALTVTVFQRSANWILPKPDAPIPPRVRSLLKVPGLGRLYRWWIYWNFEGRFVIFRGNPTAARLGSRMAGAFLRQEIADPGLRATQTPDYPIGCKRILISNDYYAALATPHVSVETSAIAGIEPEGIRTADGELHELDVIIFGTGFRTNEFLSTLSVTGRDGVSLEQEWRGGARAHLGITVPGFPNLFLLYGPNTNLGHNSIVFMIEQQVAYLLRCLRWSEEAGGRPVEVDRAAFEAADADLQEAVGRTVWAGDCRSWYKDPTGRIVNNWPTYTVPYWWRTRFGSLDHLRN